MTLLQSILIYFISPVLSFLIFLIFVWVIMSWLISFNLINLRNPMVSQIYYGINRLLNPLIAPVQRVIPSFGGLDFSPIVVLLALSWAKNYVVPSLYNMLG